MHGLGAGHRGAPPPGGLGSTSGHRLLTGSAGAFQPHSAKGALPGSGHDKHNRPGQFPATSRNLRRPSASGALARRLLVTPALAPQEEETMSWRPRNCSFRRRRDPPRPSVRPEGGGRGGGGVGWGSAGWRAVPSNSRRVPAVPCAAPPGGPRPRRRPGRAEQPAEPRAVPRRRPDPGAAGGRGAGRGGLRECAAPWPRTLPGSLCAPGLQARPPDCESVP